MGALEENVLITCERVLEIKRDFFKCYFKTFYIASDEALNFGEIFNL